MPWFPPGKRFPARSSACPLLFAAWCFASGGREPPPGDTLDLPAAETRGIRAPAPAAGRYRIDGDALRRFATLEEALESLPGFRVRRQGGLGGYSELSFRGARAAAVDVYVDGIRLNQDGDAAPDLSKWPSLWFSSLEARAGIDAAGAGPGSLVRIDLSTLSRERMAFHARAGSFSTAEAALSARAPAAREGAWTWSAGVQGQSARNDYPYFDDNGTGTNADDDAVRRMDNNAYWSRGARVATRRETEAGRQSISALWLQSRKEYPGLSFNPSRAYTRRDDWLAAWRLERFGGPLPWEVGAQARRFEDAYRDPGQSLGYLSTEAARAATAIEADARARMSLGARAGLRADLRLRGETNGPVVTEFSPPHASPDAARGEAQAGAAVDARLNARWTATAEARGSLVRFRADGLRPFPDSGAGRIASADFRPAALRAALQWKEKAQSLGATARLEQRAPASSELLGDNSGVRSRLDLRPEETRSLSALYAVEALRGGVSARAQSSVFWNDYRAPIRLKAHGASAFMRYENDADYRSLGLEALVMLGARFAEASAAVTLQDVSITEGLHAGNRPAYQTPLESHAEVFVKPLPRARFGLLADYRARHYTGDANVPDSRRPAEWELGAHAGAERNRLRLGADVRNLFDRRYRDFVYSPRSGRSASLSLSLTF